jgi:hypothetical protein
MTALANTRDTKFAGLVPARGTWPIAANVRIFKGAKVGLNSAGECIPATTIALGCVRVIGKASAEYDNRTGSVLGGLASACDVEVEYGIFGWANSGAGVDLIANDDAGKPSYAVDDQTSALTSNGELRPPEGIITEVRAGKVYVWMGPAAVAVALGTVAESAAGTDGVNVFRARNVVNGNRADLAAYTVTSNAAVNDATLNVEGDVVLLVAQTTAAQNGLYTVGAVTAAAAALTRHPSMVAGQVFRADDFDIVVAAGTVFAHSRWFNSAAGTIGTNTPAFFPESVTISQALVAGTMTITSIPILSATKTAISAYRKTANTCTATTGGYVTNGAATPGALATASVEVMAAVAAGTINNADISTLHVTITNR